MQTLHIKIEIRLSIIDMFEGLNIDIAPYFTIHLPE